MPARVGAAIWTKVKRPIHSGFELEQALDGAEALDDALGVVEAVDTDAELVFGRQVVQLAYAAAAVRHALLQHLRFRRPGDRNRVAAHGGELAAEGDGEGFAVDARLEKAIHRIDEVVAVELGMKAENAAAEQARKDLVAPGADGEGLGIGPGYVPEGDDRGIGQFLADHARQQGEVVVLHQHDGVLGLGLACHGAGELAVDRDVLRPVARAEGRPHVGDVAQRPQPLVGEAVVVAGLLLRRKPDAADLVGGLFRRHRDAVVLVHHLAVGRAAAVGDPGAGAGAHDRLQRGDQPARGPLHLDAIAAALVHVGLAVGHHDHVLAAQFAAQNAAQRLRRPGDLVLVARARIGFQFADQLLQIARNGLELGQARVGDRARLAQQAFAVQQGAHTGHPAAPGELRNDHRDQRHHGRQAHEQVEHIALGLFAAAGDEAHVVHQHQAAFGLRLGGHRAHRHVQGPVGARQQVIGSLPAFEIGAADLRRQRAGGQYPALRRGAVADGEQALVLGDAVEVFQDLDPLAGRQQLHQRFLNGVGDQRRAAVQVVHEPAQGQSVDQRGDGIGDACQNQHQGQDEAQGQSHAFTLPAGERLR